MSNYEFETIMDMVNGICMRLDDEIVIKAAFPGMVPEDSYEPVYTSVEAFNAKLEKIISEISEVIFAEELAYSMEQIKQKINMLKNI